MTYLVHINPTPGSDLRVVEVEGDYLIVADGVLMVHSGSNPTSHPPVAAFSQSVWNYVEPKK